MTVLSFHTLLAMLFCLATLIAPFELFQWLDRTLKKHEQNEADTDVSS